MSIRKIAVVGATGAVGRMMLEVLSEQDWLDSSIQIELYASARSKGVKLPFREQFLSVLEYSAETVARCDYILMSAGATFSRQEVPKLLVHGASIIDNSSAWRMEPEVPLIVPEVNSNLIPKTSRGQVIANPNCVAAQLVVSLQPIIKKWGLKTLVLSTYQSVSGAGQKGIEQLASEIAKGTLNKDLRKGSIFPQEIAFNVIPAIGPLDSHGSCEEELKIKEETLKILGLTDQFLPFMVTSVRVPTYRCHGLAVFLETKSRDFSVEELQKELSHAPSISYCDGKNLEVLPTSRSFCQNNGVAVSRVRLDQSLNSTWIQYWSVGDNLRKGAATNAVQILEQMIFGVPQG